MSTSLTAYIGYDQRQPVAFHVCGHSLVTRASRPLPVTRLQLNQLPITRRGLTEFTYSRFLCPYLSDFDGYSLFLDADMVVLADVFDLMKVVDPSAAVSVVLHQETFERPSLMLFNNKRCRTVTPEFVQNQKNVLFDMAWASKVGALPAEWNHVVGYNEPRIDAKIVHYTKGVPCWDVTQDCEYASEWRQELAQLGNTVSFEELMGASVHVIKARPRTGE